MKDFITKLFIKNGEAASNAKVRMRCGSACGAVGIGVNLCLFALKFLAGSLTNSIAITADAFNNLSDAGSSIISLLGFRLSSALPDREHPFGHGRTEYLSGLLISAVILLMGFELVKTSVGKILSGEGSTITALSICILLLSIAAKLGLYILNKTVGEAISSLPLKATALDSLSDSAATAAVLLGGIIGHFTSLKIDGWLGILVALMILRAGWLAMKDTIAPLLGAPPEEEYVKAIEAYVMSSPTVRGIHDLVVHDYGPGRRMISLHAEVPSDGDLMAMHDDIDNVERSLQEQFGCHAVIHMDPIDCDDERTNALRSKVSAMARNIDGGITIHDFRIVSGPSHTNLIFDAVLPLDSSRSEAALRAELQKEIRKMDPSCFAIITVDRAFF